MALGVLIHRCMRAPIGARDGRSASVTAAFAVLGQGVL